MLFGIPGQTADAFLHRYDQLRIGATLCNGDGSELTFLRRKGNRRTLLAADGESDIDDGSLAKYLGAVGAEQFEALFGLDHEALSRGGRATLDSGGNLGQLLFGAASDLVKLRQFQQSLDSRLSELFKPSGTNPEINRILTDITAARKAVDESVIRSTEWPEHTAGLERARSGKDQLERELVTAHRAKTRLERLERAVPDLLRRRELLVELDPLVDAILLRPDFTDERREAEATLARVRDSEARALREVEADRAAVEGIELPEPVLEVAAAIEALQLDLGSDAKAMRDLPKLRFEHQQYLADAQRILRDLGRNEDLQAGWIEAVRTPARARIQSLIHDGTSAKQKADTAELKQMELTAEIEALRTELGALEADRDVEPLAKAIQDGLKFGDLAAELDRGRSEIRGIEEEIEIERQRLTLWTRCEIELEQIATPSLETIERFEAELTDTANEVDESANRRAEAEEQARRLAQQLEQIRLEQDVPSEADLDSARARRNEGWQWIKRALRSERDDPEAIQAYVESFPEAEDLATAYERGVQHADELADRLRREANQVALKARLHADHEATLARVARLQSEYSAVRSKHVIARDQWRAIWKPAGIEPLSPREMRAWNNAKEQLLAKSTELRTRRRQLVQLEERSSAFQRTLVNELAAIGKATAPDASLGSVLETGQRVVEQVRGVTGRRKTLEDNLARHIRSLGEAASAWRLADAEVDRWRASWAEGMRVLDLGPNASALEATAVLDKHQELSLQREKAESHQRRIEGIARDRDMFVAAVQRVAAQVAPELASDPPEQAAAKLKSQLAQAREAKTERDHLLKNIRNQERILLESRATIRAHEEKLAALCREAACENAADLPTIEDRSAHRRQCERELNEVTGRLRRLAGTATLEEFLDEAATTDFDTLRPQIDQFQDQIAVLDLQRQDVDQSIGRENEALRTLDKRAHDATAATGVEAKQHLLARLESRVEEYVRLKLAAAVLRAAVERFREKNQGPVLSRAGALFADLTCGSFAGLRTDFDDRNEPVLIGVRADSGERVGVSGMSEGTHDQLFLALKLAMLEHYLDQNQPFPLILDDILVQFDDARASAALRVLAALSRRTQVIFFTHHEHLIDLARTNIDASQLILHHLPGPGSASRANPR
jgi:uncharacterized protein YhaN